MEARVRQAVWLVGSVVWPIIMILTYIIAPPHVDGSFWALIGMTVLMIIVSLSSFKVKDTNIFAVGGISLAIFLIYGVFVELVLMQVAIFTGMLKRRLEKEEWFRYALNMTMFSVMSVTAAAIFHLLGGVSGTSSEQTLKVLPIFGYVITAFILNQLILYYFTRIYTGTGELFGRDTMVEAINTAVVTPIGIILYLLYAQLGSISIIIMAFPMITMSIIFRLINNSYEVNGLLQKTNEVGSKLTEKLDEKHIIDLFFEKIGTIMNVDYVFILEEEKDPRYFAIKQYFKSHDAIGEHRAIGRLVRWPTELLGKNYRAGTRKEWRRLLKGFLPVSAQSVLVVPTRRNNDLYGAVVVASQAPRTYGKQHLMVLEIISNFLTIAIENAYSYEQTKRESERDPLTSLYNYRYFTRLLEDQYHDDKDSPFSIIMIDLDHFKQINDTYGHENGNVILRGVAERLKLIIGNKGTVARYGGEEFIILLPETGNQLCYELAEEIRQRLSSEPFLLTLHGDHRRLVHVTASIGIATAPSQGDDSLSLIRNADRAMYAGAKRRVRNRVATYIG
ncbi:MAG: sensor domain-containing diguanylate cyclase [Tuberibacillus sp.]